MECPGSRQAAGGGRGGSRGPRSGKEFPEMSWLVRSSLAMLGLSLVAPWGARAQNAPAGYQAQVGLYAQPAAAAAPAPATPAPAAPAPAAAPHKHRGKVLCARCAAAQNASMMPPGKIVGCAHSKNGVCSACKAAL